MLSAWGRKELVGETQFPELQCPSSIGQHRAPSQRLRLSSNGSTKNVRCFLHSKLRCTQLEKVGILLLASKLYLCNLSSSWAHNAEVLKATN